MSLQAAATRIAYLNYKINHHNLNDITHASPYDRVQLSNERIRLMTHIGMEYPCVDIEEIITKIEPNEKRDIDVFLIIEQLQTMLKKDYKPSVFSNANNAP